MPQIHQDYNPHYKGKTSAIPRVVNSVQMRYKIGTGPCEFCMSSARRVLQKTEFHLQQSTPAVQNCCSNSYKVELSMIVIMLTSLLRCKLQTAYNVQLDGKPTWLVESAEATAASGD